MSETNTPDAFLAGFLTPRRRVFIMLGLILLTFALRVYHLDYQSLWRDEVDALRFSNPPFLILTSPQQIIDVLSQPGHNGPLYFILLAGWRFLTGDSPFSLRYLSAIAGVLVVPLTECVARRFNFSPLTAIITACLMATSPYLIWYSQEAKMYSWLVVIILLAVYTFHGALRMIKSGWRWGFFIVITSVSFYFHILAPLILPVYALWGLGWRITTRQPKDDHQSSACFGNRWRWAVALAVIILPYLPLIWWQAPLLFDGFESGHPKYTLSRQISLLVHLYSVGILRTQFRLWAMGTMLALALYGIWCIWRTRNWRGASQLFALLWVVIPVLAVYLISLRVAVFEDRYLIYIVPAFYLLVASGIYGLLQLAPSMGGALLLTVLLFNGWAIWLQTTQIIKPDFRTVADYIASQPHQVHDRLGKVDETLPNPTEHKLYFSIILNTKHEVSGPIILMQMPYLHHTFGYYFSAPYQPLDGLWTNDGRTSETVDQEMQLLTQNLHALWFMVAEETHWDERQLTRQWLETNAELIEERHFVGVEVYRYRLNEPHHLRRQFD